VKEITGHATRIDYLPSVDEYVPACLCGWRGGLWWLDVDAAEEADQHRRQPS
jgi:hypothetical protein